MCNSNYKLDRIGDNMKDKKYINEMHLWGKVFGFTAAVIICLFPITLMLIYNTAPNWSGVLGGLIAVAPTFWTVGIIEIFTYVPMLGVGGSYLTFVTGNVTNLKVPCLLNSLDSAKTTVDTDQGEVIATISVAVSSIVTTIIIAIGVFIIMFIAPVKDFLQSDFLKPAFNNILPALFGGLGVVYISKNWKISIAPIVLMLILFILIPGLNGGTVGIMVPVGALFTIGVSRILYKKGLLTKNTKKEE